MFVCFVLLFFFFLITRTLLAGMNFDDDPFVDSYEDVVSATNAPSSRVVCWACGALNFGDGACASCAEQPLLSEIDGLSSSAEQEEEAPRPPISFRASCSDVPPRKPLPVIGASNSSGALRGPSQVRSTSQAGESDSPVSSSYSNKSLRVASPEPAANLSGSLPAKSTHLTSPEVSPRRVTSPRATVSPRTKKRLVVKAPGGAQTPDLDTIKRDADGSLSGWLLKQKAQGRVNVLDGGWKPRFVQWDPKKARLYYYHYEGEDDFANFVSFDSKTVVQSSDAFPANEPGLAGCAFQVTASYTHRPYVFCCGSREVKHSERKKEKGLFL